MCHIRSGRVQQIEAQIRSAAGPMLDFDLGGVDVSLPPDLGLCFQFDHYRFYQLGAGTDLSV